MLSERQEKWWIWDVGWGKCWVWDQRGSSGLGTAGPSTAWAGASRCFQRLIQAKSCSNKAAGIVYLSACSAGPSIFCFAYLFGLELGFCLCFISKWLLCSKSRQGGTWEDNFSNREEVSDASHWGQIFLPFAQVKEAVTAKFKSIAWSLEGFRSEPEEFISRNLLNGMLNSVIL